MTQSDSSFRLLLDLLQKHPFDKPVRDLITNYLNLAYAIGFDEGVNFKQGRKAIDVYKNGEFIRPFKSIIEAAKFIEGSKVSISLCLSGKRKTCMGYTFKLSETN